MCVHLREVSIIYENVSKERVSTVLQVLSVQRLVFNDFYEIISF